MSTSPFICNVEGSEESLKPAGSRRQLKHQVCSYALLLVLVGVLAALVLALTGGVIWMKLFQDRPEKFWTVGFSGKDTNFTSPGTQKYRIFGSIFTKGDDRRNCSNSFRLLQKVNKTESFDIVLENLAETLFKNDVELKKGATLSVLLNCDVKIDENKSKLLIYQRNS